ncbi:NAD(P)H-dependent oxidoreductase subunit E [Marispirochaeta sp.]|jgi:NADH:ubiquinone oxidoreductase subunit E|uniref:NADH-quinone oxidoreductase subunit NuoE family protein n=1 Tax=Marispirochaeta sp. TaxID=2038653 RepID=UPI0029C85C31|nr:NAD(P)H-dependent oxidoreductase subunit E [Marispirochaeta sp.]
MQTQTDPANQVSSPESEQELLMSFKELIPQFDPGKGGLIPALQTAQNLFGYIPEEAMRMISRSMDIPFSEVAGVVSFYSYFSTVPRGRHVVRVCLGTACYVRGGKEVLAAMQETLGIGIGDTTEDRQFSLEVGRCFGACGLAPVVMIDDQVHQRVRPTSIRDIIAAYRDDDDKEEL